MAAGHNPASESDEEIATAEVRGVKTCRNEIRRG